MKKWQDLIEEVGCRVGEHVGVVVLEHQYSPFSSTKALEIKALLSNLGLASCDNVINVSVRVTRIVMEED
jgi:hypothetical protein